MDIFVGILSLVQDKGHYFDFELKISISLRWKFLTLILRCQSSLARTKTDQFVFDTTMTSHEAFAAREKNAFAIKAGS
jgi:hypothetical protein